MSSWGKRIAKYKIDFMGKLWRKFDSHLVTIYGGLHPKHFYYSRQEWVGQYIDEKDIVLDIACGTGCCAYSLSDICHKVIAVDLNKPQNRFLNKDNLEYHHGDILKIVPDLNEEYTFAVAFHILEHLDDPVEFLKKVRADKIAVIVPHEENWLVSVKKDFGLNWMGDKTHKRLYNHDLLRRHLIDAGYSNIMLLEFDGDNGLRAVASRAARE
jgi:SAM-dependent methyltransferase